MGESTSQQGAGTTVLRRSKAGVEGRCPCERPEGGETAPVTRSKVILTFPTQKLLRAPHLPCTDGSSEPTPQPPSPPGCHPPRAVRPRGKEPREHVGLF